VGGSDDHHSFRFDAILRQLRTIFILIFLPLKPATCSPVPHTPVWSYRSGMLTYFTPESRSRQSAGTATVVVSFLSPPSGFHSRLFRDMVEFNVLCPRPNARQVGSIKTVLAFLFHHYSEMLRGGNDNIASTRAESSSCGKARLG